MNKWLTISNPVFDRLKNVSAVLVTLQLFITQPGGNSFFPHDHDIGTTSPTPPLVFNWVKDRPKVNSKTPTDEIRRNGTREVSSLSQLTASHPNSHSLVTASSSSKTLQHYILRDLTILGVRTTLRVGAESVVTLHPNSV